MRLIRAPSKLEHLQEWDNHHLSGQPVPAFHHPEDLSHSSYKLNVNTFLYKYCHYQRPRIKEQENLFLNMGFFFFLFLYTRENECHESARYTGKLKNYTVAILSTQEIFFIEVCMVTKYRSFQVIKEHTCPQSNHKSYYGSTRLRKIKERR